MNIKLITGILLLAILSQAGNLWAQEADFYITEAAPLEVSPGEVTTLNVTLKNLGSGPTGYAVYLKSSLDPDDGSPVDPIGPAKIFIGTAAEARRIEEFFGIVRQGEAIKLSYRIGVKPGVEEKTYTVPLVLEWKDHILESKSQTIYLGIRVKDLKADFQVLDFEPKLLEPGDVALLSIRIKNIGDNFASKVKIAIDPFDVTPVDPIGVVEVEKAMVQPDEVVDLSYPVFVKLNASENVYYTPVYLTWETYESKSHILAIGTYVRGNITLGIASVETDPKDTRSGTDDVKLMVSIENSGRAVATDVKTTLQLSDPFKASYSQSDAAYIGRIEPGQTRPATFYFDLDELAREGKYAIPLLLSYRDQRDVEYEFTTSVDLIVEPKPYFEVVEIKAEPEALKPNDHVRLGIKVENIGQEKGESVDLRVIRESGQPFTYDTKSDFIGTLNPGESGTAVLEFDVDEDAAPKDYILKLSIRATGDSERGDTNVYTQELKATISVGETDMERRSISPFAGVGIVVLLLAGFLAWRRRGGGEVTAE